MEQSLLWEQAQAGQPSAIAALLTQRCQAQATTVQVRWQDNQLQMVLTAAQAIDPDRAIATIYRTLQPLQLTRLQGVQIIARTGPTREIQWRRDFSMAVLEFYDFDPDEVVAPPIASPSPVVVQSPPPVTSPPLPGPPVSTGRPAVAPAPAIANPSLRPQPRALQREHWQILGVGVVIALVIVNSALPAFLLSPLITLVHELGHAVTFWLFGYVAIPSFDFLYGGGVTMTFGSQSIIILTLVYLGWGYLFYRYWENVLTARLLLASTLVYIILAHTAWHEALATGMGHGFELIFIMIFLYRALSGFGCRVAGERSLNAFLGCFIWLYDIQFAYRLIVDREVQNQYFQGKGSIADHDFVRLASDYLHLNFFTVMWGFLLLTLLIPLAAGGMFRYDQAIASGLYRLFGLRSDAALRRRVKRV